MKVEENELISVLREQFPEAKCELHFSNNFELLVAVILSAQCTDKRVNTVTPNLFNKYPSPKELSCADLEDVENIIHSCGFYHNKAKNIIAASKSIMEKFNGEVPNTKENLKTLNGVGEKTSNVVFSVGFGGDALAVDTHVFRVSNRLGISKSKNPLECEKQLQKYFNQKNWSEVHHLLVLYGRYVCTARSPKCDECKLKDKCKFYKEKNNVPRQSKNKN